METVLSRPCHAVVVIPTFNNAPEIRRAVSSVLTSAAASSEHGLDLRLDIVLADDGSTHDSAVIGGEPAKTVDLPAGVRILAVRHDANRGAGPARNTGVAASDAEFVFFLDADDEFLPPHIGLCLDTLLSDPAIGYVWGRRAWDLPVHDSWRDRLNQSSVMNLCLRRPWHDLCLGFPEHPDFRDHGYEDCACRVILRRLVRGRPILAETTRVHLRDENALDRPRAKFTMPFESWGENADERQPTPAMIAELDDRLERARQLREAFLSSP